ncbi:calcium:proton antiporter [Escherichia coli]|nr:calcium:proton antiporter [Salmonella enterica subsp. enterica]EFG2885860.1 calcium:proton antiporter [Escherichia coli]EFG8199712.1 calcium:proton antiporter [Escherichia coli]
MSPSSSSRSAIFKALIAWGVVIFFLTAGRDFLSADMTPVTALACFALLFATILMASFGVVREADHLAHSLGEPYGTLILTLSIVSIEVILIAAVMLGPSDAPTIARDSIFAVMMIIVNLVTGVCLIAGALRNGEQEYNAQGSVAFIAMIVVLTGTALILPNMAGVGDGSFLVPQAVALALMTVVVYGAFLLLQMGRYRHHYMQPLPGRMSIRSAEASSDKPVDVSLSGGPGKNLVHAVLLLALILPIVLLAHDLAVVIDYGVARVGAPVAVGGVLIAIIVFTPESITAVKAALNNETQRAINLCLGAFVSTVGLTVPAVLTVGLLTGKKVVLGISPTETTLFALTIALTTLTYLGRRTSATQGLLHLMLFCVYTLLLFVH